MTPSGILTLLTDFGRRDGYVGAMKGVALQVSPKTTLVDVTHEIDPQDVLGGAFVLASVTPWYPVGTVHVAVVDPGVGSARRAVAARTSRAWLVGPDNGLLALAIGDDLQEAVEIERIPTWPGPVSATFHGRDLFAPAGAHLAATGSLADLGGPVTDLVALELPRPREGEDGALLAEVIHVDEFGNAVTNVLSTDLPEEPSAVEVQVGGVRIAGLSRCYADVPPGEVCALIGSDGRLEISVAGGSAAAALRLARGTRLRVSIS